jgi:DNA-binding transcriptional LysR family regulator
VDLGLVAFPVKDSRLEVVLLGKEPFALICHPQHSLAKKKSIKLTALEGQNFVSFEPDVQTREAIDKMLDDQGVNVKRVTQFDNVETVKRAVEIDAGVSIVPQSSIHQEIQDRTLASVVLENRQYTRPLAAIYKKDRVLSPAMKQFLATLKSE